MSRLCFSLHSMRVFRAVFRHIENRVANVCVCALTFEKRLEVSGQLAHLLGDFGRVATAERLHVHVALRQTEQALLVEFALMLLDEGALEQPLALRLIAVPVLVHVQTHDQI